MPTSALAGMAFSNNNFASDIGTSNVYQLFADTVIQYSDTAIWSKGSHTLKMGFQGFRQRINTFYSGNNGLNGTFTFNGQYSGRAESDFLLGLPSEIGTGTSGGTWGQRANIFGGFVQDDWRAAHNLTLNLGLRYEIHTPWVEVKDRETNFGLFSGAVEQPGQNGNSRALYNTYNGIGNWQPRVGFAYSPGDGKTVIRGAYTLSTYLEGNGHQPSLDHQSAVFVGAQRRLHAARLSNDNARSGLHPGECEERAVPPALLLANAPSCVKGLNVRLWDPNVMPALSNQWNFTVQRQFGNSSHFPTRIRRTTNDASDGGDTILPKTASCQRHSGAKPISGGQSGISEPNRPDFGYLFKRQPVV